MGGKAFEMATDAILLSFLTFVPTKFKDAAAREKVGQLLREMIARRNRERGNEKMRSENSKAAVAGPTSDSVASEGNPDEPGLPCAGCNGNQIDLNLSGLQTSHHIGERLACSGRAFF